ncbi:MAG TPA: PilZ domain-containing protein, partial [Candidatus Sulfotelmatobacter sp.]|nr:PilZ domain-containing protein [Candidatus Sulfotelmatobacter sp.]
MSTSTEYMDGLNTPAERRFYPRVTPPTPIYVAFGSNNLGVLHNVSENGFQVTTPSELALNSVFRVFLSLNGAPKTISVTIRTIWTNDAEKRAGIQLLDLADEDRQQIRSWVEFEMSRNESSTPWFLPKSSDGRPPDLKPSALPPTNRRQTFGAAPVGGLVSKYDGAATPVNAVAFKQPAAPASAEAPGEASGKVAAEVPVHATPVAAAANPSPGSMGNPEATAGAFTPRPPAPAPASEQPAAVNETGLPTIANPFDEPDSNSQFTSPFPSVPLPIHGEFEYVTPPPRIRRRSTWSSRLRAKPLILWAAALALVCVGANALVRYKIKQNSRRFATESAAYVRPKSDVAPADSSTPVADSSASTASAAATDSQSAVNSTTDADSKKQPTSSLPSSAAAPVTTGQNGSQSASNPTTSHRFGNDSDAAQPAPGRESSLDARQNRAYTATAPPASDRSEEVARSSQRAATPRVWSAPAPSRSWSAATPSEAPQSPNVTSSSNNVPVQSTPAPVVAQTRPAPPPPPVQAATSNSSSNAISASNSNAVATTSNPPARTQAPPPSQPSTYASNTNTTPRPQSQIYNANTPAQRSAIIGSINSVHSSGIFDSNDSATATAAPPPTASRGNANANVATRPVSNSS